MIGASWTSSLVDFHRVTGIADFWREHASNWEEAQRDLVAIFRQTRVVSFLNRLRGQPVAGAVAVVPSIVYPMLEPVLATTAAHLYLILPPAKAWGESPPWPFGEDPPWVVAQTCWQLAAHFLAAELARLDPSNQALLQHAAVTLCLEQEFDEAEAMAYLVRTKKEHQLPQLPVVAERLRAFLSDPHDSRDPAGRPLLSLFE